MPSVPTVALAHPARLGEGPLWSPRERRLWWIDIRGRAVHAYDPATGNDRCYPMPSEPGMVALRSGGLLVALRDGLHALDPQSGALNPLGLTHQHGTGFRFNDGACDAAGRLWVGTLSDAEREPLAHLYCIDAGGCRRVLDGLTVSNGIGWSPDGATMYLIDSPTRRVDAFTFDCATGTIAQHRTAVVFPTELGFPDGLAVDAEGMIWVGMWGGWRVQRCDPANGRLLEHLALPVERVSACAFAGDDLRDLYITTVEAEPAQLSGQPLAGFLFKTRLEVAGVVKHAFAG